MCAFARQIFGGKLRRLGDPRSNVVFHSRTVGLLVCPRGPHITACENVYVPGKDKAAPLAVALPSAETSRRFGLFQNVTLTGKVTALLSEHRAGALSCLFSHGKLKLVFTSLRTLQKSLTPLATWQFKISFLCKRREEMQIV